MTVKWRGKWDYDCRNCCTGLEDPKCPCAPPLCIALCSRNIHIGNKISDSVWLDLAIVIYRLMINWASSETILHWYIKTEILYQLLSHWFLYSYIDFPWCYCRYKFRVIYWLLYSIFEPYHYCTTDSKFILKNMWKSPKKHFFWH